jgi:outer membrane protein assembly factor BamB
VDATPLVKDGLVVTISNSGMMTGNILANGKGLWHAEIAGYHTPWVASGHLFLLTSDHVLVCMRQQDGAIKWITPLRREEEGRDVTPLLNGPVMVNGRLMVVSAAGELMLFSAEDGHAMETYEIPEGIKHTPVIALGSLYLLSADATLYRFGK